MCGAAENEDVGQNRGTMIIAGHPYAGYTSIISRAFSRIGYDVTCIEYTIPSLNSLERLRMRLSESFWSEFNRAMTARNASQIEKAVVQHKPDFVLVINGNALTRTTINFCESHNTKLAMWAYDSYRNFNWIGDVASQYDLVFTYEPQDVGAFSTRRPAIHLPMAFDPDLYYPTKIDVEKTYDVSFAGAIRGNYPERTRRLRAIGLAFPNLRIRVIAPGTPLYSPFRFHDILITLSGNATTVLRGWSNHSTLNEMYNKSRICINMHGSQSDSAVNPRSFEILGSGGLLLTDRPFPKDVGLMAERDYLLYSDDTDMIEKIEWAINNPVEANSIARNGHDTAFTSHTYVCRAKRISGMLRGM